MKVKFSQNARRAAERIQTFIRNLFRSAYVIPKDVKETFPRGIALDRRTELRFISTRTREVEHARSGMPQTRTAAGGRDRLEAGTTRQAWPASAPHSAGQNADEEQRRPPRPEARRGPPGAAR